MPLRRQIVEGQLYHLFHVVGEMNT